MLNGVGEIVDVVNNNAYSSCQWCEINIYQGNSKWLCRVEPNKQSQVRFSER